MGLGVGFRKYSLIAMKTVHLLHKRS